MSCLPFATMAGVRKISIVIFKFIVAILRVASVTYKGWIQVSESTHNLFRDKMLKCFRMCSIILILFDFTIFVGYL